MIPYYGTHQSNEILKPTFDHAKIIHVNDHMGGFSKDLNNPYLQKLNEKSTEVRTEYIVTEKLQNKYPNIKFKYYSKYYIRHFSQLSNYTQHPDIKYKNFLCSFNGSPHVSRQLLVSILNNQGLFDTSFSTKNFTMSNDEVIGHLNFLDLTADEIELYNKFFYNSKHFNQEIYSIDYTRDEHHNNLIVLQEKLTQSFVHVVSETMAISYYPFVTEKFLYSIVTRGLFLAYAQPDWHAHLEKYFGFKRYTKVFDYSFDNIENPVKRLIRLIETVSKFRYLNKDYLMDLYLLEKDTIEYNYNHYFSGDYIKCIKQLDNTDDI